MASLLPRLDESWRVVEILGGWALEYQDPCCHQWHEIAQRSTLKDIEGAYERIQNGGEVEFDEP